jgi:L-aspartate oxidase
VTARASGLGFDIVVVGSGIAGLCAALTAAPQSRVAIVTKGRLEDGCTFWAQGGIAAAVGADDSAEDHLEDTLAAGRGLCDEGAVRILVEEAPKAVAALESWGTVFDRTETGALSLHQEASHRRPRVLHARGDATGREIEEALAARARSAGITLVEECAVTRLLLAEDGGCTGVEAVSLATGTQRRLLARAVILATGGAGRLFRRSSNPAPATGDGLGLAYEAGAEVASCEFVQFHPTALALPGAPAFLISEALRGAGAIVTDHNGRRFLLEADPRGELAPRDTVARAIQEEMATSGADSVLLDCRPVGDSVAGRFPSIAAVCRDAGIDIATTPIPVAPAAHYLIGGVRTDHDGTTAVAGLYAAGEIASTGVHGANRLASNSLLEGAVFGPRAARAALRANAEVPPPTGDDHEQRVQTSADLGAAHDELHDLMGRRCGMVRDGESLVAAREGIAELRGRVTGGVAGRRLDLALTGAGLIVESALIREESRGAHVRADFPEPSDQWHGVVVMQQERGAHLDRNLAAHH